MIPLSRSRSTRPRQKRVRFPILRWQSSHRICKRGKKKPPVCAKFLTIRSSDFAAVVCSETLSTAPLHCYQKNATRARIAGQGNTTICYCWHICLTTLKESSSTSNSINCWSVHLSGSNTVGKNWWRMRSQTTSHSICGSRCVKLVL